jgi:hypothetical protein
MKKANIMFLRELAQVLEGLPRTHTLDKLEGGEYKVEKDDFVYISAEWCNNIAEELKRIFLEERIGNEPETAI